MRSENARDVLIIGGGVTGLTGFEREALKKRRSLVSAQENPG